MYPSFVIDRAKELCHESVPIANIPASTLMRFFNQAVESLTSEIRAVCPLFGMVKTTITQVAGTDYNALPAFTDRLLILRDNENEDDYQNLADWSAQYLGQGFALSESKLYWVRSDVSNVWELWYTRVPWQCHYGTASAADATSLTLPSAATAGDIWTGYDYTDYYKGARIYIRSCGTTTRQGQSAECTASTSAGKLSVASWPGGTPDSTIVYEIMPLIELKEFSTLVAWEVALRIMVVRKDIAEIMPRRHPYQQERSRLFEKYKRYFTGMSKARRFVALDRG